LVCVQNEINVQAVTVTFIDRVREFLAIEQKAIEKTVEAPPLGPSYAAWQHPCGVLEREWQHPVIARFGRKRVRDCQAGLICHDARRPSKASIWSTTSGRPIEKSSTSDGGKFVKLLSHPRVAAHPQAPQPQQMDPREFQLLLYCARSQVDAG